MDELKIVASADTPEVTFTPSSGSLYLAGISVPEYPAAFFDPIVDWLREYAKNPSSETTFTINLEYINSASSKHLYRILDALEEVHSKSKLKVIWQYVVEDELMQEEGEEFQKMVPYDFECIEISE